MLICRGVTRNNDSFGALMGCFDRLLLGGGGGGVVVGLREIVG